MTYMRLPTSTREEAVRWNFPLGIPGFRFADLNRVRRLAALDREFLQEMERLQPGLAARLEALRAVRGEGVDPAEVSAVLVEAGRHLGPFLARLFHIQEAMKALDERALADAVLFDCRKHFLERRVWKMEMSGDDLAALDPVAIEAAWRQVVDRLLPGGVFARDPEREFAEAATRLLKLEAEARAAGDADRLAEATRQIDVAGRWAHLLARHPALRERARGWTILVRPEKIDFMHLVERHFDDPQVPTLFHGPREVRRFRDGFDLTDRRMTPRQALGETHYCIICHERGKDSCSHGFPEGAPPAPKASAGYRRSPLGTPLTGCPLEEKISEMHLLKRTGHSVAALAMIMVDNPLCAGTGHRICNDCMRSCIYQKQTPVDIPQAETSVLTEVLRLPYGFEIYSLLTRWNPLNPRRPYPLPYNGKKVLVVGMGPAGYALSQHLLNEGFGVVGVEGLKVEPLSMRMRGSKRRVPQPIENLDQVVGPLDQRTILGFGGVSEYGITVRWDKNFLDLNYIALMRRKKFRLYDGVRFGGTLTIEDCWRLGFDHIALATGAGRPTLLAVKNNLLRGVRAASDFLMGLQGTGIYRRNSLGNLQVQLPAIVVGGGLTAIDTATELQAYYAVHVEKTLERYERLAAAIGEAGVRARFEGGDAAVLDEWLEHGRAVRAERAAAAAADRPPDFNRLIRAWGGVIVAYRKRLQDSPAYRLNHEEIAKALEEGIGFAECIDPAELLAGPDGALRAVRFERQVEVDGRWRGSGEFVELPARSVMVAAGTHPNAMYEREVPGSFQMDKWGEFYLAHRLVEGPDGARRLEPAGPGEIGFFTSYMKDDRTITFYGDNHPAYAGNVVRAMASARFGHREILRLFARDTAALNPGDQPDREVEWVHFAETLDQEMRAVVVDVVRLTGNIVEVIVRAPLAARNFHPGQFYRLQNYESFAEKVGEFSLGMEGLALTGAWVDVERGLLSTIVLEMGGSSRLCALLEPGEEVVLMGPTGTPTEIPSGETVLLAGGGLGNAVLFSIAAALKQQGNRVIYFAGYKKPEDLYKRAEIEKACDLIIWSCDIGPAIPARRPQDRTLVGNIVQAMEAYASGKLGPVTIPLQEVDRILTIGSDRMMAAVKAARRGLLAPYLKPGHTAIGSINSPMQCMMKEICAQCLQRRIDPVTGEEGFIFTCNNQDQELDAVDFDHLAARLRQNSAAEKLTMLWIDHLFEQRVVRET